MPGGWVAGNVRAGFFMSIRVRFAPSPTGYLHIGGARTALFNWLYARHTGGTFVLRMEDTDDARNTREAVDVILDGLRWLGLDWDEGPVSGDAMQESKGDRGPYFQSQRGEIYQRRIQELLDKDLAYEHEGAVKFRMTREPVTIPDVVAGDVVRKLTDREEADPDFVIVRSDGKPVFHLVNVVDDIEMGITHVIRGEDHLSTPPTHLELSTASGPGAGRGGTDLPHPLDIVGRIDPEEAWPELRRLLVSTTGQDSAYYVLDDALKPVSADMPGEVRVVVDRIGENCEPALCSVMFMAGAGGSLRARELSWENTADRVLSLYESVLRGWTRPAAGLAS